MKLKSELGFYHLSFKDDGTIEVQYADKPEHLVCSCHDPGYKKLRKYLIRLGIVI